jgi:hypothetical protein
MWHRGRNLHILESSPPYRFLGTLNGPLNRAHHLRYHGRGLITCPIVSQSHGVRSFELSSQPFYMRAKFLAGVRGVVRVLELPGEVVVEQVAVGIACVERPSAPGKRRNDRIAFLAPQHPMASPPPIP